MHDVAIRGEGLGKRYRIGKYQRYKALRDVLAELAYAPFRAISRRLNSVDTPRASSDFVWALKDVSFEIKQGEVVGLIGPNGSGKTTLLKILSRITEPTEGLSRVRGRVGSLLEVGTGFHPELTGRENIYLNGAILGMKKTEIRRKFDEITAFAEIEQFVDTPVKQYSSGMYVRLAFAVAAFLEPEILLVDEVLAVGDAAFQRRCMGKMRDVTTQGRTILFVSHNMAAIQGLCRRVLLLNQGRIVMVGDRNDVVQAYLSSLEASSKQPLVDRSDRRGDGRLRFVDVMFRSRNGTPVETVQSGQSMEICIAYRADREVLHNVAVYVGIDALDGHCMSVLTNEIVGTTFESLSRLGQVSCHISRLPLMPGEYYLDLYCEVNGMVADEVQHAASLVVEAGDFFGSGRLPRTGDGDILIPQTWSAAGVGAQVVDTDRGTRLSFKELER